MTALTVTVGTLPTRIDIQLLAGERLEVNVPVLDGNGAAVAAASLLSARAQVRQRVGSGTVLYTFTTADSTTAQITGTSAAVVKLLATPTVTAGWRTSWPGDPPRSLVWWNLEVTDSSSVAHQITSPGTITLFHQITV